MDGTTDLAGLEKRLSSNLSHQTDSEYKRERAKIAASALYNYATAILGIAVAAPIVGYFVSPVDTKFGWNLAGVPIIGLICMAILHTAAQGIIRNGLRR